MNSEALSILIVEENTQTALELESKVLRSGHKVAARIYDTYEAIQFVKDFDVDVVLMNINIDGNFGGRALAQDIVSCSKSRVVLLTGKGKKAVRHSYKNDHMQLGMTAAYASA